jgi:hypothetical protein
MIDMNSVIQFILDYKDPIFIGLVVILGLILFGRKKAVKFALSHLGELEKEVVQSIKDNPSMYAKMIYGILPKPVKVFATPALIEKVITKFLDNLDK